MSDGDVDEDDDPDQVFEETIGGILHHVVATDDHRRRVTWSADGIEIASGEEADGPVRLDGGERGRLVVSYSSWNGPRRVSWHPPGRRLRSCLGVGGIDLIPSPGSSVAIRDAKVLAHPVRHVLLSAAVGVVRVAGPLALLLVFWWAVDAVPAPERNVPQIPFPDLPSIPWLDLSLPRIGLPDWQIPWWIALIVIPAVTALMTAWAGIRRRRAQAARRTSREP